MKRFVGITLIVLAVFAAFVAAVQVTNNYTNWRAMPVMTDAMAPTINKGALVFSSLTPESEIKSDDIITVGLGKDSSNLIGRVMNIEGTDGYYTLSFKGDNRAVPEPFPYKVKDVTYVANFHIPFLGYVVTFFSQPGGFLLGSILAAVLGSVYLFVFHQKMTWEQRSVRRITRARQKAIERMEERELYGGTEQLMSLFQSAVTETVEQQTEKDSSTPTIDIEPGELTSA